MAGEINESDGDSEREAVGPLCEGIGPALSPRMVRLAAANARRSEKRLKAVGRDACTWASHLEAQRTKRNSAVSVDEEGEDSEDEDDVDRPCCSLECSTQYEPDEVRTLRLYHMLLPKSDKREFLRSRTIVDRRRGGAPRGGTRICRSRTYRLDTPAHLQQHALEWAAVGSLASKRSPALMRNSDLQVVCGKFYAWVTHQSTSSLYQLSTNLYHDVVVDVAPKSYVRATTKRAVAIEALTKMAKDESLKLPDQDLFILHTRTRRETYETVKLDLQCQGMTPSQIPSRSTFIKAWSNEESLKNVRVRRTLPFAK